MRGAPSNPAADTATALTALIPLKKSDLVAGALWDMEPDGIQQEDAGTLGASDIPDGMCRLTVFTSATRGPAIAAQAKATCERFNIQADWVATEIEATDWNAAWKAHYAPVRIGEKLFVVPAWEKGNAPPGRTLIYVDPGQAFGTGTHETTQLVAELLERHVPPGGAVLDVGTGSGLLAIAAVKLGAHHAIAVDNDAVAVESAHENVRLNEVPAAVTLHVAQSPSALAAGAFPLVMANIISSVLLRLRDDLLARVQPGGVLLLSGVLGAEEQTFLETFLPAGWMQIDRVTRAEWIAVALKAPP